MPPVLEPPVDLTKFPITHAFWVDETNNPQYQGFYTLFDNHHPGVDFALPEKTPISSSVPGVVVRQEFHQGMGNVVATRLGNIYVLYAHLSQPKVNLSDMVSVGDLIGLSGNTGQATTMPHLHFELRDLRETELKKMVFAPGFGQAIDRYQKEFVYHVNNANQPKNFLVLARRYFGSEKYASFIRTHNPLFSDHKLSDILPEGEKLIIPSA